MTRATNAKGASEFSERVQIAVAAPPVAPAAPVANYALSSESSVFVAWTALTADPTRSPGADVTGYQLLMATPETGEDYEVVFDSVNLST